MPRSHTGSSPNRCDPASSHSTHTTLRSVIDALIDPLSTDDHALRDHTTLHAGNYGAPVRIDLAQPCFMSIFAAVCPSHAFLLRKYAARVPAHCRCATHPPCIHADFIATDQCTHRCADFAIYLHTNHRAHFHTNQCGNLNIDKRSESLTVIDTIRAISCWVARSNCFQTFALYSSTSARLTIVH